MLENNIMETKNFKDVKNTVCINIKDEVKKNKLDGNKKEEIAKNKL